MSILTRIGAVIKKMAGSGSRESALDKAEVLTWIDSLLQTAESLKEALAHPAISDALRVLSQTGVKGQSEDLQHLQKLYMLYFHALPTRAQQMERDTTLSTMALGVAEQAKDLVAVRENFTELFGDDDTPTVKLSEMTVTMAALSGALTNIDDYFTWIIYFIGHFQSSTRLPPYQIAMLDRHVADFSKTTVYLITRPASQSLVALLKATRQSGADVHLQTDGQSLDSYAADSHYRPEVLQALNGFTARNPIMMVGGQINHIRQVLYERNKAQREWLASKIAQLTLQSQGMDVNSPEALRLNNVIARYADMVATLDRKLGVESHG